MGGPDTDDRAAEGKQGAGQRAERRELRRDAREEARASGELRSQRARTGVERFLTRTTSGVVYAIVVIVCVFAGRLPITVMVSAMAWLCCSEFFRITRMGGRMPNELVGLTAAALYPLSAYLRGFEGLLILSFLLLFACGAWYVTTPRASIGDVCVTAFGPLYTAFTFSSVVLIRNRAEGISGGVLVFGVILSLWANDALAYMVGSRIGRHKMAPRISPKKSWEGFFAGIVGCVVVWVLLGVEGVHGLRPGISAAIGLVVGVSGVVGDLFESRIKRGAGVKDSGNVIPGHGGLLDRSDSLIFGCSVAYIMLHLGGIL